MLEMLEMLGKTVEEAEVDAGGLVINSHGAVCIVFTT